ncbi:MAG: DUF433 domain-containing protein [bacterium]|nr:DUF433 domain-containing protein [bacterium]
MSDKIVRVEGVCGGQPVVRGTRTSVLSIINYLEVYGDKSAILRALPHLSPEDIEAALMYYRQHTDEIEQYRREEDETETWPLPNKYVRDTG